MTGPIRRSGSRAGSRLVAGLALALALAGGCIVGQGPRSRPAAEQGMLVYTVGRLSFEAPGAWRAEGNPRKVKLESAATGTRLDAQVLERTFPSDAECLASAEAALARGSASLTNVRRHPTTLAGRKGIVQEADREGWHGWAWAVCDGGEQYRIFFTGRSPLDREAVRAARLVPSSAALATRPGA